MIRVRTSMFVSVVVAAHVALFTFAPPEALHASGSDPDGFDTESKLGKQGSSSKATLTKGETQGLDQAPNVGGGSSSGSSSSGGVLVIFEYKTSGICRISPDSNEECASQNSGDAACGTAGEPGPMARVWVRKVAASGPVSGWSSRGTTCFPEEVPGGDNNPQLTIAMIREAAFETPFAKPQLSMQPVGDKTLVTLPAYFKLNWPTDGFAPDEVHSITLLGYSLRIKPTFMSNTYKYGDGSSSGSTKSMGGTYPNGDIKHPYTKKGTYKASVSTRYGAQVSLEGSDWMEVEGSVDISGPALDVQVVTAKNRLVRP